MGKLSNEEIGVIERELASVYGSVEVAAIAVTGAIGDRAVTAEVVNA